MAREIKEIIDDLDKNMVRREQLDRVYWRSSEKLNDEWEALMKEMSEN